MGSVVCSKDGISMVVSEWDGEDAIAVIVIHDEDVVVARAGWGNEFTSEVHVGLSGGLNHGGVAQMSAGTIVKGGGKESSVSGAGMFVVVSRR